VGCECNVYSEIAKFCIENWKTEKAVGKLRKEYKKEKIGYFNK
jgi:hypothetical protein